MWEDERPRRASAKRRALQREILRPRGLVSLAVVGLGLIAPIIASAQQSTASATQCVSRVDYPAGTNNYPYNFARFYNTCNALIEMFVVGSNGATDFGEVGPGNFLVMSNTAYPGAPLLPTSAFACVAPGRPTKVGGTWRNGVHWGSPWPGYGDAAFECPVVQ